MSHYSDLDQTGRHHPVLLVGLFALDLLIIHPFHDGNGRVARVLTNALLTDGGYGVGRYVSIEQLIAEDADSYYSALLASTHGWHKRKHDPWPWLEYFITILDRAYQRLEGRVTTSHSTGTKQERVRDFVRNHAGMIFRMADIRTALPGISDPTIRLALEDLRTEGIVALDGTGRAAVWRKVTSVG